MTALQTRRPVPRPTFPGKPVLASGAVVTREHPTRGTEVVVVHRKRVVAVGADREALVRQAAAQEQCPPEDLVVVAVPSGGLWEIPH